jgi:hypothetical protein
MKRDMDLIRTLLTELEEADGLIERTDKLGVHQIAVILDHRLAEGRCSLDGQGLPFRGILKRLTWDGHEFLDAMRDDTVWRKVKERVLKPGASWTFGLLLEYARAEIRTKMGT